MDSAPSPAAAPPNSAPKPSKNARKSKKKNAAKKRDDEDAADAPPPHGAADETPRAETTDRAPAPAPPKATNGTTKATVVPDSDGEDDGGADGDDSEIERLRRELGEEQAKSRRLQEQHDSMRTTNSAVATAAEDLRLQRNKSQDDLRTLQEQLRKLQDQIKTSEDASRSTAAGLEGEIQRERNRSQELERQVQSLTEQLSFKVESRSQSDSGRIQELEKQMSNLRTELEEEKAARAQVVEEKDRVDMQYKTLLGRVSTIKSTLGERMKADAEELAQSKRMLEEVEEQNQALNDTIDELRREIADMTSDKGRASGELTNLRTRLNLAQQNWSKEREDLVAAERYVREELEAAKQAAQDWEVIAVEERSVREQLSDRIVELEEQQATQKSRFNEVLSERDRGASTIEGLQRALQEIQEARRKDRREIVEDMQARIDELSSKSETFEQRAKDAEAQLKTTKEELERLLPFEKEAREKNLAIGKLRHEAVTLNDHLRKALRMLKRDNADDKVDKQLITNVFLQFVSIQRGDTKKYEVLQLIASVLDWNDEQREKAGLLRPGTASSNSTFMKTPPMSPFHRSPSTPTLGDAYEGSRDLWSSVLGSEKS